MPTNNDHLIHILNNLLENIFDAKQGYDEASTSISTENSNLRTFLQEQVSLRDHFSRQLQQEIVELGGHSEKGTSLASTLHRTWIKLKSEVVSESDRSVINECIRGEAEALADYNDVLQHDDLPDSTQTLLEEQKQQITEVLDQLHQLKSEAA